MTRTLRAPGRPDLPAPTPVLLGGVILLAVSVTTGLGPARTLAALLLLISAVTLGEGVLQRWTVLLGGLVCVMLFIPVDRYDVQVHLPFALEPYRAVMIVLLGLWIGSLLIDPRVRSRRSGFEAAIGAIALAVFGSELFNPGRVGDNGAAVVKSLTFFASFVALLYLAVSVVRSRRALDRLIGILVIGGGVLGALAVLERATGLSPFNHLASLLPILSYHEVLAEVRNGSVRAAASSGHPIEFAVVTSMLLPLAIYMAVTRRRPLWTAASVSLVLGCLATGSRTGFQALLVVIGILLWLRPRQVVRLWPAIIPVLVAVHVFVPGALGGLRASFFPHGGLVAEQSRVVSGNQRLANNRLADWGPSLREFARHNAVFGEGYGTRVTGFDTVGKGNAPILDNQWLKTLLETGLLGLVGWLVLFGAVIRRLSRRARALRGVPDGWLPAALTAAVAVFAASMFTYDAFSFIQGTVLLYLVLALSAVYLHGFGRGNDDDPTDGGHVAPDPATPPEVHAPAAARRSTRPRAPRTAPQPVGVGATATWTSMHRPRHARRGRR